MSTLLIMNAFIVCDKKDFNGYVLVESDRIKEVGEGKYQGPVPDRTIDAEEKLLIPGLIDDQVHFRQPGLTYKADIRTESMAAAAGGITSFMEMPNTVPQTTTIERLGEKFDIAAQDSSVNYSFYLGATNDNIDQIRGIDPKRVCGLKVFMGSSTGNMLVDNEETLRAIFTESPVLIATHCEDEATIRKNLEYYTHLYGEKIDPELHPLIRSAEACYVATAQAVSLADKYGADLHVLHLSTERELGLFSNRPLTEKKITNEVCVHHLWFNDRDYRRKGNMIKWNPAIKTEADRSGLIRGIDSGRVDLVATDHAPHTLGEKQRPYLQCPSGGPLVQHSLNVMLELYKRGEITLPHIVDKMCHAPAIRYRIKDRGFIREGYFADLVLVDLFRRWEVETDNILYKCKWSPFEEENFTTKITHTLVNGEIVYENGVVNPDIRGRELVFDR